MQWLAFLSSARMKTFKALNDLPLGLWQVRLCCSYKAYSSEDLDHLWISLVRKITKKEEKKERQMQLTWTLQWVQKERITKLAFALAIKERGFPCILGEDIYISIWLCTCCTMVLSESIVKGHLWSAESTVMIMLAFHCACKKKKTPFRKLYPKTVLGAQFMWLNSSGNKV